MPTFLLNLLRPPRPGPSRRNTPSPGRRTRPTEPDLVADTAMSTCFGPLARLR